MMKMIKKTLTALLATAAMLGVGATAAQAWSANDWQQMAAYTNGSLCPSPTYGYYCVANSQNASVPAMGVGIDGSSHHASLYFRSSFVPPLYANPNGFGYCYRADFTDTGASGHDLFRVVHGGPQSLSAYVTCHKLAWPYDIAPVGSR